MKRIATIVLLALLAGAAGNAQQQPSEPIDFIESEHRDLPSYCSVPATSRAFVLTNNHKTNYIRVFVRITRESIATEASKLPEVIDELLKPGEEK